MRDTITPADRQRLLTQMGLRTNPFLPDVDLAGNDITPPIYSGSLQPADEPRSVGYYYDVYDWSRSASLGGLDQNTGLRAFPTFRRGTPPPIIFVSGTNRTGRSSLVNLILFRISASHNNVQPLVIQPQFSNRDRAEAVMTAAKAFISRYVNVVRRPNRKALQEVYDAEITGAAGGPTRFYPNLFQTFHEEIAAHCRLPIVFVMQGFDDYGVWQSVYESITALANYCLVETPKSYDVKTVYDKLKDLGRPVAWVDAPRLTHDKARAYIAARVNAERINPTITDSLFPLDSAAVDAIYEPGSNPPPPTEGVRHSIGWLQQTLSESVERHLAHMASKYGGTVAIPLQSLTIGPDIVRDIREELNEQAGA